MSAEITRRETLRRGAALGGALLWSVPVVQTLDMTHAFAALPSGPTPGPDVSFIALNVTCGAYPAKNYFIKFEAECETDKSTGCFEDDPGNAPGCAGFFFKSGQKANGAELGFEVKGPHSTSRCYEIEVPDGCRVTKSAIKGGRNCCPGPVGEGALVFCPPHCPIP
jgi:hypothetical protein